MSGVSCELHICFRVRVSTFAKRDPKDRDGRESTSRLERPVRKGEVVTCLSQIVNEPDQVIYLGVLHVSFILLPMKCLVEPVGELGRRSVER